MLDFIHRSAVPYLRFREREIFTRLVMFALPENPEAKAIMRLEGVFSRPVTFVDLDNFLCACVCLYVSLLFVYIHAFSVYVCKCLFVCVNVY